MIYGLLGGEGSLLHQRIIELRKKNRLTQEGLAKKIGVTRSALSQYELDVRQPDYDIVKRMADYFDVTVDYLLGREAKDEKGIKETEADAKRRKALGLIKLIKDDKTLDLTIELLEKLSKE